MSRLQPRRHDSAENQVVILVAQSINRKSISNWDVISIKTGQATT